jgi:hypothetical protein
MINCFKVTHACFAVIRTGLAETGPTQYAWPVPDGDEPRASRPGEAPIV